MSSERYLPVKTTSREFKIVSGSVNSINLLQFLAGTDNNFPYLHWEFAPRLNLKAFTPYFKKLYESKQEVYIYPPEIRELGAQLPYNPFEAKAAGERALPIYYDLDTHKIRTFAISYGDYASVNVGTISNRSDTIMPILETHTHPYDSLFSPMDYARLLQEDPWVKSRRIVQGIVVLNPQIQVLALPTSRTPFYKSSSKVHSYIKNWQTKFVEDVAPYEYKGWHRVQNLMTAARNRIISMGKELDTYLAKSKSAGTLRAGEEEQLSTTMDMYITTLHEQINYLRVKTLGKYMEKKNNAENVLLTNLAQDLHVQLYTSTDMQHFLKASA